MCFNVQELQSAKVKIWAVCMGMFSAYLVCFLVFNFGASSGSSVCSVRHHGETPAVCRSLSELLWIPPGGQHVALSAASLHRLSGGHQHPSALLRPAVSSPGQPQRCSGGEAQRQRHIMLFPHLKSVLKSVSVEHEVTFCLCRLHIYAPWSHANLQSSLSDCSRTGVPSQEEHHLLWPQIGQHSGVVSGGLYVNYRKIYILFNFTPANLYHDRNWHLNIYKPVVFIVHFN